MDAKTILEIKKYYQAGTLSIVDVGLALVCEGCNAGEASRLIEQWNREKGTLTSVGIEFEFGRDSGQHSYIYSSREEFEEDEEMHMEERPDNCVCPDKVFDVYGCMCQIRRTSW